MELPIPEEERARLLRLLRSEASRFAKQLGASEESIILRQVWTNLRGGEAAKETAMRVAGAVELVGVDRRKFVISTVRALTALIGLPSWVSRQATGRIHLTRAGLHRVRRATRDRLGTSVLTDGLAIAEESSEIARRFLTRRQELVADAARLGSAQRELTSMRRPDCTQFHVASPDPRTGNSISATIGPQTQRAIRESPFHVLRYPPGSVRYPQAPRLIRAWRDRRGVSDIVFRTTTSIGGATDSISFFALSHSRGKFRMARVWQLDCTAASNAFRLVLAPQLDRERDFPNLALGLASRGDAASFEELWTRLRTLRHPTPFQYRSIRSYNTADRLEAAMVGKQLAQSQPSLFISTIDGLLSCGTLYRRPPSIAVGGRA